MAIIKVTRPTLTPEEFIERVKKIEDTWSSLLGYGIKITEINMDNVVGDKQIVIDYLNK